jgi:hypothetical protein
MSKQSVYRRVLSGTVRLLRGYARGLFSKKRYHIKRGYHHRQHVVPHDDTGKTEEYQREVYESAAKLAITYGLSKVIDIGCGSAYKLVRYLGHLETIGIETASMVAQLRRDHPERQWLTLDEFTQEALSADLIICADVIEHVADPHALLRSIMAIRDWRYLVISTPERDVKRGWYHFGPPPNPHHYREWNMEEFGAILSQFIRVESISVTNERQGTQMAVCVRT